MSTTTWPARDAPGLRIGDAAALLGLTVKAIRVYHEHGLVPEPQRDESGYRRYDAHTLVVLARITRLRGVGLPLREIAEVLRRDDDGATLRAALHDLAEALDEEIAQLTGRRALVAAVLEEGVDDPLSVSAPAVQEERAIALLRRAVPGLSAEEEAFERDLHRALAALSPPGADTGPEPTDDELLAAAGGLAALGDRHRRLYALRDADADDARVQPLADDLRDVLHRTAATAAADVVPAPEPLDPAQAARLQAGIAAALGTLPPAIRRVWELVLGDLLGGQVASASGGGA